MVRQRIPDQAIDEVLNYDSAKELGLKGAVGLGFPRITGLSGSLGGLNLGIGVTNAQVYYADKPSGNISITWVRGSHTYKAGSEWHRDIFSNRNRNGSYGSYGFSSQQTTLPSTQGMSLGGGSIGFAYASFLLGQASSASVSNASDPQYRKEAFPMFVQDSWKITRKLTIDYGLRWDYIPAMHELWDRVSAFDPNKANPAAGNLLGATAYEGWGAGRINGRFAANYPYAFGPRIGLAYQLDSKTVVRAGWGITYARTADFNYMGPSSGVGYDTLSFSTSSYGDPAVTFASGMQYNLSDLYQANYDPGLRPRTGQIDSPGALTERNGGRPPRLNEWSIGVQRELMKDLVVEANYVGNRGAWFEANGLIDLNALTPERLRSVGLDINLAADRTLLTSRLDSATAASRGFGNAPYATYSKANTVALSLRPYPQFGALSTRLAPLGNTWYDSLQMKATKRFSRGLWLRAASGGWVFSGVLRYASGALISVPGSQNALSSLLFRGTRMNRVPDQPLYTVDLNCGSCYDPQKDFVLNPKAWSDAGPGQWGYGAAYYNDYRYQRHPDEQLSLGRGFRVKERVTLAVRMEFFNVFNRTVLQSPSSGNPLSTQTRDTSGVPTSGFGYINTATVLSSSTSGMFSQRYGQLVMRLQF
jgi:hypothetical protein